MDYLFVTFHEVGNRKHENFFFLNNLDKKCNFLLETTSFFENKHN